MNFGKNDSFWWYGLLVNNLVRFAVPMFLLLSGATLLTKKIDLRQFYQKRFSRVLIPALFWVPAYWIFRWFMLRPWQRPHDFDAIIKWGVDLFVREGVSVHLWYVYMILLLYLIIPLISKAIQKSSKSTILIFLFIWMLINTLQSLGVFSIETLPILYKRLYTYLLYVGYLVLGYSLRIHFEHIALKKWVSLLVFFVTVIIACAGTYWLSAVNGELTLTFMGTFTINTLIQTVAVFFLFKNAEIENSGFRFFIQLISDYSFGIYFVHIMIISLFFRVGIFWTMAHPAISVPIVVLLTLISSVLVIFLLRKIPGFKHVSG
jgi:surface polysaccharide O-acyltransferase-like enzyme